MVLKRLLREGGEEGSDRIKRQHLGIFKGLNHGRTLQESVPYLEPIIRKWVQEAIDCTIDRVLRSSYDQVDSSGSRCLQLVFHSSLPHTLFTGSRVVSEDRSPMKVALCDSISKQIITSGPLASQKVTIVVLDGDFGPDDREDWTTKEFDRKIVKSREGKRPLVTGELTVTLSGGVGYIGDVSFTDNSSWIRSGKFRLGAKVHANSDEISIREAMSNAFKVKDHRGESYQKHYPPSLDDEVWRLEKIAKDGSSHKKLTQFRITSVRDFLRLNAVDQFKLRAILDKVSNKTWETIIKHATTCSLDDKRYLYRTAQGTGLLFNSIYNVVGVTFDGQIYHSVESLSTYRMKMVEDLKQQAYKNSTEWVSVCDPLIAGYPMLAASSSADSFANPNLGYHGINFEEQDERAAEIYTVHPTMSPPYKTEVGQDNCSLVFGESSHSMQCFNPTLRNGFGASNSLGEFHVEGCHPWACGGNYVESHLSTSDLPITDNFMVESSAWQGNRLFLDSSNHEIGIISSNSGIPNPRSRRSKIRWCKVLAVVKWQILVRRNVAARRWNHFYSYM